MFDTRAGLPRTLIETPRDTWACGQNCASPPRAESLTCRSSSHLLLWFESNGSHRHRRVTLPDDFRRSAASPLRGRPPGVIEDSASAAARKPLRAALRVPAASTLLANARTRRSSSRAMSAGCCTCARALASPSMQRSAEELDTAELIALARRRGWTIYLPRIDHRRRGRKMQFVQIGSATARTNRLGDRGAARARARSARAGSISCSCRSWASMRAACGSARAAATTIALLRSAAGARVWHAPRLIGVAYSFQQVEHITPAAHDVLLDAVVTEKGMLRCATG